MSIAAVTESGLAFWQQRKPRERNALVAGAAVVAGALVYVLAIAPAIEGRRELGGALPPLRQQAAEMRSLAQDAARLGSIDAPTAGASSKDALEASLQQKGLKAQSIALEGGVIRLQLSAVSFARLIDWLADAQRALHLTVIDAAVTAKTPVDSVDATITLRQQKMGGE